MKRNAAIAIAIIAGAMLSGCANLGNGKLDGAAVEAAKNVDKVALIEAAAAGASGDYAKALQKIAKAVQKNAPASAASPLEGYEFTREYFYMGQPVPDPSRITWIDKWQKTGSAGKSDIPQSETGNAATSAPDENDALAAEIADILAPLVDAKE